MLGLLPDEEAVAADLVLARLVEETMMLPWMFCDEKAGEVESV